MPVEDRGELESTSGQEAATGMAGLLAGGSVGVLLGVGIGAGVGFLIGMLVGRAMGESRGLTKGIEIGRLEAATSTPQPRRWRRLWRRGSV